MRRRHEIIVAAQGELRHARKRARRQPLQTIQTMAFLRVHACDFTSMSRQAEPTRFCKRMASV